MLSQRPFTDYTTVPILPSQTGFEKASPNSTREQSNPSRTKTTRHPPRPHTKTSFPNSSASFLSTHQRVPRPNTAVTCEEINAHSVRTDTIGVLAKTPRVSAARSWNCTARMHCKNAHKFHLKCLFDYWDAGGKYLHSCPTCGEMATLNYETVALIQHMGRSYTIIRTTKQQERWLHASIPSILCLRKGKRPL